MVERRILGVGIAVLDIVNQVSRYPTEDEEVRATAQRIVRGGNVANTLCVLSQFGHSCDWAGTYADDAGADLILAALSKAGVGTAPAVCCARSATPTSYITLSEATASRTIVHYRQLREFTAEDLAPLPIDGYHWVHFEGRHAPETSAMIARVREEIPGTAVSIEIEKPRPEGHRLLLPVDVLFFSRAFVEAELGANVTPRERLAELQAASGARLCVAAWGAEGAYAVDANGEFFVAPAAPPVELKDTLAAGDVFNAAMIDGLLGGRPPADALRRANRVAGFKCGRLGVDGLVAAGRAAGVI